MDRQILGHVEENMTRGFENERHREQVYEAGIQSKLLATRLELICTWLQTTSVHDLIPPFAASYV